MKNQNYQIMTHIVAGYPSMEASETIAQTMIKGGVDYLEIQIPFSDPVADGPIITQANHQSIEKGTKIKQVFELVERLSATTKTPIFLMTYYNIPFVYGLESFCKRSKIAGAEGLIIPDLPYDEESKSGYLAMCKEHDLSPILVVAPNTSEERLKEIGHYSKPMIYCVAQAGTTGTDKNDHTDLAVYTQRVRKYTDQKIALGFGISSQEQIEYAGKFGDIVVIGSQLIREYNQGGIPQLTQFLDF